MTQHHDPTTDTTPDSPTWNPGARVGTHWSTCWRDGGPRHHACAVTRAQELEAQIAQAEAATVAAMHTGDYAGVILPDPPPALYRRISELEAQLAAVRKELAERTYWRNFWRNHAETHERMWREAEELRQKEGREAAAQLAAVPAYAAYYFDAQLHHDLAEGPEPLDFDEWLAAGKPEDARP